MSEFSFNSIENFDDHIAKSIPNYDLMFQSIIRLSDYFKDDSKVIYDLGCSTGNLLRAFQRINSYKGKMVGLDMSRHLLPENTKEYPNIKFIEQDLTKPFAFDNACIVYAMFIFQFLPKEARLPLLKSIYAGMSEGSALFFCEKVYCDSGKFQDMFTSTYHDYKKQSFTEKEIFDKERSLRTMLKPNTRQENLDMLEQAGFRKYEIFWSYFQFTAYLVIK